MGAASFVRRVSCSGLRGLHCALGVLFRTSCLGLLVRGFVFGACWFGRLGLGVGSRGVEVVGGGKRWPRGFRSVPEVHCKTLQTRRPKQGPHKPYILKVSFRLQGQFSSLAHPPWRPPPLSVGHSHRCRPPLAGAGGGDGNVREPRPDLFAFPPPVMRMGPREGRRETQRHRVPLRSTRRPEPLNP